MNRALRALVTAWADAVKDAVAPIRDILPVHLLMNPDPLRSHPIHPEETPMSDDSTPDRTFVDDLGRRWEWCGGQPGTWAWRVTHLRPVTDNECRRRELDEMGAEAAEIDAYRVANDFKETR